MEKSGQGGEHRLGLGAKLGFGVGDLGGNIFFTAMGFWTMNYLTDVVGMAATLAAIVYWVGKAWDAVTDPMMGFISDHTRSRWGRRRPWLLFGSLPLLLCMWGFFTAPSFAPASQGLTFAWALALLCLLNTAYTVVNIPYGALTPDLATTYDERTTLNVFRFSFAVIGTIVGAAAVKPIADITGEDVRAGFSLVGLVLGAIMCLTTLITFFSVREKPLPPKGAKMEGFLSSYGRLFSDKPYIILLMAYALNLTGITFLQGIIVYYFKYVFDAEGLTALALLALLATAAVCVPLSLAVIKRIGKKRCYQLGMLIVATVAMVIFAFGHLVGPYVVIGIMILAGVGIGFGFAPPYAMLPDAIAVEARRTGKSHEGSYYGMWTFFSKLGTAFAGGASLLILSVAGYRANEVQDAPAIMAIRLILGPVSAFVLILAILMIQRYPIDQVYYDRAMAGEDGRRA
jgi:GPH family glycoside/pentoside/hexuronide:cation symporter